MNEEWMVRWVEAVAEKKLMQEVSDRATDRSLEADIKWDALKEEIQKEWGVDPVVYMRRMKQEKPVSPVSKS